MTLKHGHLYRLRGMKSSMWQVGHPHYGRPPTLVGVFLGKMQGTRTWYGFEIRVGGKERGVLFMPQSDLDQLQVEGLGPYTGD